jgi:CRISPR-associated protein (TIGR03984 family)
MTENTPVNKLSQNELEVPAESVSITLSFLQKNAKNGDILLAYFQDGVLWGKVIDDELIYPKTPEFNDSAFLRAFLFNKTRELRVIQTSEGLKAFESFEHEGYQGDDFSFDRNYLLWGDKIANPQPKGCPQGFTLVEMGQRGIRQMLPFSESELTQKDGKVHRVVLNLRYYAKASQRDADQGNYHVYARRLLGLSIGGK